MTGAIVCLVVAIIAIIWGLTFKPKRPKSQSAPKRTISSSNNLGRVKNYDQGRGIRTEPINEVFPSQNTQTRESKAEQASRLDILHQQFRDNPTTVSQKPVTVSPEKRDISIAKLRKLTKMVNGQEGVARRLIEGNLKAFPDKSPDWACDKAVSDLERDRRM